MLVKYKQNYNSKNLQFLLTDRQGIVVESDQTFIAVGKGIHIGDIHPFFTSIFPVKKTFKNAMTFSCVYLDIKDANYIADIEVHSDKAFILVMIHNLTEHYTTYQATAQDRNESLIASELVTIKNQELLEREKFKNQFISNFSHELRNPLTSIIAITHAVMETDLEGHQKQMIDFLKDSTENLKLMLEDILSISMIASGRLQLGEKLFSLTKLLQLLEFTYTTKAKKNKLEFSLKRDERIPEYVEGDRLRLFQVLTNLLDNAFKYTESGIISLNVQFNQKNAGKVSLRFQVSDSGVGIPEESLSTAFESFSQLNAQNSPGVGLGLSIVKGLLELMKSKIKVDSTLGEGSVFYFDISLKYPVLHAADLAPKEVSYKIKIPPRLKSQGKFRLLLVEDNEAVQLTLFKILTDIGCFYIDLVDDGAMIMEQVINNKYDIILMDVNLPNIDGDQVTRLIRDFPFKNIKSIPIIGLTANAFERDIAQYKEAGMNAVISKPFDFQNLLEIIFKYLKK